MTETSMPTRVRWARVWLFYGIAFAWLSAMALIVKLVWGGLDGTQGGLAVTAVIALGMFGPLIAALVVDRIDGRRPLILSTFKGFSKAVLPIIGLAAGLMVLCIPLMLGLSWLGGNVLGIPGVGVVDPDPVSLGGMMGGLVPAGTDTAQLALMVLGLTFINALIAGLTINALFAFGEEYGWRGWLMDELRPLGTVKANLVTGALWGFWHAPVIIQGYNYGAHRILGVACMMVMCTALSFLFWRAREVTGSVIAPAVLHGTFNAFVGIFGLFLVGADPAISVPLGLLGALGLAILAGLMWLLPSAPSSPSE